MRKKILFDKVEQLSNAVDELKSQIHEIRYPNGNLSYGFNPFTGDYISYTYVYDKKIVNLNISRYRELKSYKIIKDEDKAFIGVKVIINNELIEQYYIVSLNQKVSVETTPNLEPLYSIEWEATL